MTINLSPMTKCIGCGAERDALDGTLLFEGQQTMLMQARVPCGCGERRFKIELGADADDSSPSTKDVRRLPARSTR